MTVMMQPLSANEILQNDFWLPTFPSSGTNFTVALPQPLTLR